MATSIQFESIETLTPHDREEVVGLWRKNSVLTDDAQMEQRLGEVVMLVKDTQDGVIGVSTVRRVLLKSFNNNYFYEFRCFIDPAHRQPALDTQLVIKTKEFLEKKKNNTEAHAIGLIMVIENELLKRWTRTVWAGADFYFAGFTSQGHHVRVSYFKDASI